MFAFKATYDSSHAASTASQAKILSIYVAAEAQTEEFKDTARKLLEIHAAYKDNVQYLRLQLAFVLIAVLFTDFVSGNSSLASSEYVKFVCSLIVGKVLAHGEVYAEQTLAKGICSK